MGKSNRSQPVKINAKGRVQLTLIKAQAMLIKPIIEDLTDLMSFSIRPYLTEDNAKDRVYVCLINEIYLKYYAELDHQKDEYKITISKAQAIAFWELGQRYPSTVYAHPVMNNIMFHLHQKLV